METILSLPRNIFVNHPILTLDVFLSLHKNTDKRQRLSLEKATKKITSPTHLSPLQQEFLIMHCELNHLPFTIMLQLAKMNILPRRLLKLRNDLPPCIFCLFGKAHCWPWRQKSSSKFSFGVLCSLDINKTGQQVGTDQILSAQPGLVPQEKGSMTRTCVWGATASIDYATHSVKVHLIKDT